MMQASAQDKKTNTLQPAKLNIKKSKHGSSIAVFLGKIFRPGYQIIDLSHYKNASCLKTLPETGDELGSSVACINYFMSHVKNFASLSLPLRAFAAKTSGLKKLDWEGNPEMAKTYLNLVEATQVFSGLAVIPNDLATIHSMLIASDASNATIGYILGVALKPKKPPNTEITQDNQMGQTHMRLVTHYSKSLENTY